MFAVVGTTNVDLIISGVEQMPSVAGDEFTVDSLVFNEKPLSVVLGGNGGNAAYALGRLGAPVMLCSAIGKDPLGDIVQGWLGEAGVDLRGLQQSEVHATSTTTIVTATGHNRLSYHHRGAMGAYGPAALPEPLLEEIDVLLISSYPLLRMWRKEDVGKLLKTVKRQNALTALDIGPAIAPPATLAALKDLLPDLDFLIANQHELSVFTGADDWSEAAAQVFEAGTSCLILKRGKEGAVICRPGEEPVTVVGFPVEAQSTVGAGDSFNAGFLYAIRGGEGLEAAARFGNGVAALVVSSDRGILGSPTRDDVAALLRQGSAA